ncbi:hypothetical protein NZX40_002381 [Vibrio vulnificus]|nr:hypothetical protein [Vibrio vulnificus]
MIEGIIGSIFSGVAGNGAYDLIKKLFTDEEKSKVEKSKPEVLESFDEKLQDSDIKEIHGPNIDYHNNYKVFDSSFDFYKMVKLIKTPIVHIIIESEPSTAYHLPLIVAEDSVTKEWYVFSKGRLAFEGNGGGISNSKNLVDFLIEEKIRFSAWVLDFHLSEKLSQGCKTWPELREQCVPLIAYSKKPSLVNNVLSVLSEKRT